MAVYQNKEAKHLYYNGRLISNIYAGSQEVFRYQNLQYAWDGLLCNGRALVLARDPNYRSFTGNAVLVDGNAYTDAITSGIGDVNSRVSIGITNGSVVSVDDLAETESGGWERIFVNSATSNFYATRNGDLFLITEDSVTKLLDNVKCFSPCLYYNIAISGTQLYCIKKKNVGGALVFDSIEKISDLDGWTDLFGTGYLIGGVRNGEIYTLYCANVNDTTPVIDHVGTLNGCEKVIYSGNRIVGNFYNPDWRMRARMFFIYGGDLYQAGPVATSGNAPFKKVDSGGWSIGGGMAIDGYMGYAFAVKNGKIYRLAVDKDPEEVAGELSPVAIAGEHWPAMGSSSNAYNDYYGISVAMDKDRNLYWLMPYSKPTKITVKNKG